MFTIHRNFYFCVIISASFKMGGFNIPASTDLDTVQSSLGYISWFLIFCLWRSLWYAGFIFSDPLSKFYSIQFRPLFSRLGHIHSFIWGPYAADHEMVLIWKYRVEDSMFTDICMSSFGMDQNCTVYWCKYWVALNPWLGCVGSNMHFHYCP
jgi:hypothetical protein